MLCLGLGKANGEHVGSGLGSSNLGQICGHLPRTGPISGELGAIASKST